MWRSPVNFIRVVVQGVTRNRVQSACLTLLWLLLTNQGLIAQTCRSMAGTWTDDFDGGTLTLAQSGSTVSGTYSFSGNETPPCSPPAYNVNGTVTQSNGYFSLTIQVGSGCNWITTNPTVFHPMGTVTVTGTLNGYPECGTTTGGQWADAFTTIAIGFTRNSCSLPNGETTTATGPWAPKQDPNTGAIVRSFLFTVKPTSSIGQLFQGKYDKEFRFDDAGLNYPSADTCFQDYPHAGPGTPIQLNNAVFDQAFGSTWIVSANGTLAGLNQPGDVIGYRELDIVWYRKNGLSAANGSCGFTAHQSMRMQCGGPSTETHYKHNVMTFTFTKDKVEACRGMNESGGACSPQGQFAYVWPDLAAPTSFVASATSSSQIQLTWAKPDQGDKTGFLLSKKVGSGAWTTVSPTLSWSSVCSGSSCTYSGSAVTGLTAGTEYCFKLQSADDYTNLDPENTFDEDYGDDFSNTACDTPPYPSPGQMSFGASSIFQGDAFNVSVQNGANMTIDVEYYYNNAGPYEVQSWASLNGSGSAYMWDTMYSPAGEWVITQIRNHAGGDWVDIEDVPITVYNSPYSMSFNKSSVSKAINECFTFTVGNGANMLIDVGVVMPDHSYWTSEEYGYPQLDANGQETSCVSSESMEGYYRFNAMKNHASPNWVWIWTEITVTP